MAWVLVNLVSIFTPIFYGSSYWEFIGRRHFAIQHEWWHIIVNIRCNFWGYDKLLDVWKVWRWCFVLEMVVSETTAAHPAAELRGIQNKKGYLPDVGFSVFWPVIASNPVTTSSNSEVMAAWRCLWNWILSSSRCSSIFFSATCMDNSLLAFSLASDSR